MLHCFCFSSSVSILEKGKKRRMWEWTLQPVQALGPIPLLLQRATAQPHQVNTQGLTAFILCFHTHTRYIFTSFWPNVRLQEVLRGKDRDLLRVAGLLHGDAVLRGRHGSYMLHLWSAQLRRQHIQVSYSRTDITFCFRGNNLSLMYAIQNVNILNFMYFNTWVPMP